MVIFEDRTPTDVDTATQETPAIKRDRANYTTPDSLKLYSDGMGSRQWRGSKVAAKQIQQALELGLPITAVMFYPPGQRDPVELQAHSYKVNVKITFPDRKKFWKKYREHTPKGGVMTEEEEAAAVKSKKMILESFDLFMASQRLRLTRSSRAAIETLKTAIVEDAGAVVVMYVPKDLDEPIEYQCYSFETKIKISFPD